MISRRGLITGLSVLVAAPALVRADSLMPIRGTPMLNRFYLDWGRLALDYPSASWVRRETLFPGRDYEVMESEDSVTWRHVGVISSRAARS